MSTRKASLFLLNFNVNLIFLTGVGNILKREILWTFFLVGAELLRYDGQTRDRDEEAKVASCNF